MLRKNSIIDLYKKNKLLLNFISSIILIIIGWGITVTTYSLLFPKSISIFIRLTYGLLSTSLTNYYLEEEFKNTKNIKEYIIKYQYYFIYSIFTIISGWYVSVFILNKYSYLASVITRTVYGVLATFIALSFIPKEE